MHSLKAKTLLLGFAGFVGGCGTVHVPLKPIDSGAYLGDKNFFLAELSRIAGSEATDCGFYHPTVENNSQGVACVRSAWSDHHAFIVANEYREGYCPNLVGYVSDNKGHVYLVQSCPDRDHVKAKVLHPSIYLCQNYEPPVAQYGDGQCSALDRI